MIYEQFATDSVLNFGILLLQLSAHCELGFTLVGDPNALFVFGIYSSKGIVNEV